MSLRPAWMASTGPWLHYLVAVFAFVALASDARADLSDTIERVKPSVVAVGTYVKTREPAFAFHGTGFVVGDGTLVATNAHVVPETMDAARRESLVVVVNPGRSDAQVRSAEVHSVDKRHDVALVRMTGGRLPALSFHDSPVREGLPVAFTGFPIGALLGLTPVTHRGTIAAITPIVLPSASAQQLSKEMIQRIKTGSFLVFQLDATSYPGNSGSPLFDVDTGAVLGVVNMAFVKTTREAALSQPSGISFAIPVQFLRDLLAAVK